MIAWLPLALLLALLGVGLLADRLAARTLPDRGAYWTRVLLLASLPLALALLASWLIEAVAARRWQQGWHLLWDQLHPGSTFGHLLAATVPLGLWLLALVIAAITGNRAASAGRWLAGSIGLTPTRHWLLAAGVAPLAILLAAGAGRIGAPPPAPAYPLALWALGALTAIALGMIALSHAPAPAPDTTPPRRRRPPTDSLPNWPTMLRARGIACESLVRWAGAPATPADPTLLPAALAARALPASLVSAVLASPGHCLLEAPDDAGQLEAIAACAERAAARGDAVVLLICPDEPAALRERLLAFLPDPEAATLLAPTTGADSPAWVWLTDAMTLSDRLLPRFVEQPRLLQRVGTLVWWDLHRYSGVLAANFWAITHRFDRLLNHRGGPPPRQLACVRGAAVAETQLSAFVNLCLPGRFEDAQTAIPATPSQPLDLYLLGAAGGPAQDQREPSLAAAAASVAAGWPTHVATPGSVDALGIARFRASLGPAADRLVEPVAAAARILEIDTETVLDLPDLIAQTGRLADTAPVQIGLLPAFGNPYVASLLQRLAREPDLLARRARRMVAAEPQPGVIKRHLLLALNELADTPARLDTSFRREQTGRVQATLRALADKHELQRREVRYLAGPPGQARLAVEVEYSSVLPRDRAPPLTSLGDRLVDLYDPGAEPVLTRIDPERLTIEAYPWRVFLHQGRRYRVSQWQDAAAIAGPAGSLRVQCRPEDRAVRTWRVFAPRLSATRGIDGRRDLRLLGRGGLARALVETTYREWVSGYLEYAIDPASGHWVEVQRADFAEVESLPLPTTGFLLQLPAAPATGHGLHSLAQALRHVFPVHVGVAEDAVAIVPFAGHADDLGTGLMIVDLYPGGIGLVQSLDQDLNLLLRLLADTRDWLANCPCRRDEGCARCLQSPLARSAMVDPLSQAPSRRDALALLALIG
ncbi:MAG: DUF1998 domain-containing protein [Chromatiaceae bacterium]|nr:MAG: DUF1998 domain-containing protein [Chromatiaceae bacterium]